MGYTHGSKWTDELIEKYIRETMRYYDIDTMPTRNMMKTYYGGCGLTVAINRTGGVIAWAQKLNLEHKGIATAVGRKYEEYAAKQLEQKSFKAELMKRRYPYDILADGVVKIDVKASHLYKGKQGNFFTFNIEKAKPTCDIYIAYCIDGKESVCKTYIIPSAKLTDKTQLSVGEHKSIYDSYLDRWDIVEEYRDFCKKQ